MSKSYYKHGQWNVQCDVCGFEFKSSHIRKRWDGLRVCKDDWEERHPMDFFRSPKSSEGEIPFSRPAGSMSTTGTDINGSTYPPTRIDTVDDVPASTFNITSPIT